MKLKISDEVSHALANGIAVVALESTIISHGMPYPQNLQTALEVEAIVRENGAVPATIAILQGVPMVGLPKDSLEMLAKLGGSVTKVSRRDIASVIARKGNGATTVSATMVLAHMAGISMFVTGGIGGVHRGATTTMDISADLTELGRTPVAVVCAGAKSILDIGLTLEFLETQGVPVVGYGTNDFPAFFSPSSGFPVPCRVDSATQAAAIVHNNKNLNLQTGMIFAVPIPPQHAAEGEVVEQATQQAVREAEQQGVKGNDVTPFLLRRINEITQGKSLVANIHLVKNNAKIGSQIARQLAQLQHAKQLPQLPQHHNPQTPPPQQQQQTFSPIAFGGAAMDIVCRANGNHTKQALLHTSTPGHVWFRCGGVARNVAEVMAICGASPRLVSIVGDDSIGNQIIEYCNKRGINTDSVQVLKGQASAVWNATLDCGGDLLTSVADMAILSKMDDRFVAEMAPMFASASVVFFDTNMATPTLAHALAESKKYGCVTVLDPVSVPKSKHACDAAVLCHIDVIKPNILELIAMASALTGKAVPEIHDADITVDKVTAWCEPLLRAGVGHVTATHADRGTFHATLNTQGQVTCKQLPFHHVPESCVVNTTGAGDTFTGALCAVLASRRCGGRVGLSVEEVDRAVQVAQLASMLTVMSDDNAPDALVLIKGILTHRAKL